ncbi:MAG: tRNA (adenosine(37)-N6)-threonylcarbamoyltransferase complex ATPase subunit type 1 TsaE [Gemmatimonadota bacterium]
MRLDEPGLMRWGRRIGEEAVPPLFLGLRGPLGAGKSVLARAVGAGAGVEEAMPSPSYNLVFRYPGRMGLSVVHMDLYRISGPEELDELGWTDLGHANEIVLVEWPERARDLVPADHWVIELMLVPGEPNLRDVAVTRVGRPSELPPFPFTVSSPEEGG